MSKSIGNIGKPTHISRQTEASEFFALATWWLSLSTFQVEDMVDAIVAWPGIEMKSSTQLAVNMYNNGKAKHLLIAGYHEPEVAGKVFSEQFLTEEFGLKRLDSVHTQVHARHAGMQSNWTAEKFDTLNIKSVILCVPAFHILRSALGILESCRRKGVQVMMFPKCPAISPYKRNLLNIDTGQQDACQMEVIHGEINGGVQERIPAYQREKSPGIPGDNLTTERFLQWLDWLYQQPLIKNQLME